MEAMKPRTRMKLKSSYAQGKRRKKILKRGVLAFSGLALIVCGALCLNGAFAEDIIEDPALRWASSKSTSASGGEAVSESGVSYTTFQSVPDQVWDSESLTQPIALANPSGNSVDMAPHIYVDIDLDGQFSDGECLWNAASYDDDGNLLDRGVLIAPGQELDEITLSDELPSGSYNAKVIYSSYLVQSHEAANPMSFEFGIECV